MNDSRFNAAFEICVTIDKLEKLNREEFGARATGHCGDLNTLARDTLRSQIEILRGVHQTINSLSNMLHEAERGSLFVRKTTGGQGQQLTTEAFREAN